MRRHATRRWKRRQHGRTAQQQKRARRGAEAAGLHFQRSWGREGREGEGEGAPFKPLFLLAPFFPALKRRPRAVLGHSFGFGCHGGQSLRCRAPRPQLLSANWSWTAWALLASTDRRAVRVLKRHATAREIALQDGRFNLSPFLMKASGGSLSVLKHNSYLDRSTKVCPCLGFLL